MRSQNVLKCDPKSTKIRSQNVLKCDPKSTKMRSQNVLKCGLKSTKMRSQNVLECDPKLFDHNEKQDIWSDQFTVSDTVLEERLSYLLLRLYP